MAFGGAVLDTILIFAVLAVSGSVMLGIAVAAGGLRSWRDLPWPAKAAILFFLAMPLLQLVPLPPAIWHALPGRGLSSAMLGSYDMENSWRPITMSVSATFQTALVFLWLVGLLLALLQLSRTELRWIFGVLVVLALVNVVVGAVQVASGGAAFQLYHSLHRGLLQGLFANKNHTGLLLALAFPAAYAARYAERGWSWSDAPVALPMMLVLLGALVATFSRAGLALGLLAVAMLAMLSAGRRLRRFGLAVAIGAGILFAVGAILLTTPLGGRAMERFMGVGGDLRWSIWPWSIPLLKAYFPIGAGIGTYATVFKVGEQLQWVKPTYVNSAHNEYIEQLVEVGIAAPIFWTLLVLAVAGPLRSAWAERQRPSGRMALIGGIMLFLFALHSIVDYPLRRPALAVVAMVAAAAVLRMRREQKKIAPNDSLCKADSIDGNAEPKPL